MNACFWDTLRVLSVLPSRAPTPVPLATVCPNIHCREVVAKQNMTAINREPHSLKHTGPAQKNWVEPDTHRHSFKPALHRCLDLLSPCQVNGELAEAVETGDVGKVRTCIMMQQLNSHKAKWTKETERAALFANPDSEEVGARMLRVLAACRHDIDRAVGAARLTVTRRLAVGSTPVVRNKLMAF